VCGPFAARGAKGEEEYPKRWLGGTGEIVEVGKQEQEQLGAGAAGAPEPLLQASRAQVSNSLSVISCYAYI